ncbi:hypothetical protein SAMN04487771_102438 [[Clostridium] aminophilum]|uniref:Uncharacterized protein n=1 Tax=[Clostridium] aminophilum TaxID=1526 RepID=A0A1I0FE04_9FIRM|nr:hypothetical protein SAMN04487771_102438 [[Clostridium] aminophilum]
MELLFGIRERGGRGMSRKNLRPYRKPGSRTPARGKTPVGEVLKNVFRVSGGKAGPTETGTAVS